MATTRPLPLSADLAIRDIDLDRKDHQKSLAATMFPEFPSQFNDNVGIFLPHVVYRAYLTAVADELWAYNPDEHIIKDVGHLLRLLQLLRQNFNRPKARIVNAVARHARRTGVPVEPEKIAASVEFGVKVWFLADFQTYNVRIGDATGRPWRPNVSLSQHFRTIIADDEQLPPDAQPNRRFSNRFTLYDMDWLYLIKIRWTNNIAQHLYLEEWKDRQFKRTVYVFSHTAMMESIVKDPRVPNAQQADSIQELMLETMDTLDLLMDRKDPAAGKWYRKMMKGVEEKRRKYKLPMESMDEYAGFPRRENSLLSGNMSELRRVGHYRHWQPRLLKLEKAFKESTPTGFRGWWRDKRNRAYWATFLSAALALLVAVLAVVFSAFSVVTGPWSTDLARKANDLGKDTKHLAEKANELAKEGLTGGSGSPSSTVTAEPQSVVVVIQGCCEYSEQCMSEMAAKERRGETTKRLTGVTTCATSIGK